MARKRGVIEIETFRHIDRFPRLVKKDREKILKRLRFLDRLRAEYPAPAYNPHYDGSWNPAGFVLGAQVDRSTDHLRGLVEKHGMDPSGSRQDLMRQMYLHWRAAKLGIGYPFYGYGPGYRCVVPKPTCVCGFMRNTSMTRFPRTKRFPRLIIKGQIIRFPREKM